MSPRGVDHPVSRQRGFALMWAMFLVILVGGLGAVVVERDLTMRRAAKTDLEALQGFHAAEGGLARARHALARDPAWSGGSYAIGPCRVKVRVTRDGAAAWRVLADATPGAARVEAVLERQAGLPAIRTWREDAERE